MNKFGLLSGVSSIAGIHLTPAERQMGRLMRAPDGHEGGDDSNTDGNNTVGNSGTDGNNSADSNNSGEDKLDLSGFWDSEEDDDDSGQDDPAEASKRLGAEIGDSITKFTPPPVFTKEIADAIANGDLDGVNAAMQKSHQETIKQAVQISAKLVGAVMDRMMKDFDSRIEGKLGQRDDTQFLQSKFPIAKDPAHAPMVQRVWDQAMKQSKGDRAKAERLTRGMLEAFGTAAAPESLRTPPQDPTHGVNTAASKSLVESLLGRE